MKLLIFIIICAGIYFYFKSKRSSLRKSSSASVDIPIKVSVSVDSSPSFDNPDTGDVISSGDGWLLNPKSTFPLTVYGIDKSIALEMKKVLDSGYSQSSYYVTKALMPLIAQHNIECKEADDYVKKFKTVYLEEIEKQKATSPEWASASALDQEDLLSEFRATAINSLDVRPDCNLEILFEAHKLDLTIDDALVKRYGFDTISFYIRKRDGVHIIPADHYERKIFEKLTEVGLAFRGDSIPLEAALSGLKLKELSALVSDLNPPKFSRKAKAIEYLTNVPDIRDRIGKVISLRSLFQIQPLPSEFAGIDINAVSHSWQYAQELAYLISGTYMHAGYSMRRQNDKADMGDFINGWEIMAVDDDRCCPYCKRAASKKYSKNRYPKTPLHIGCRCTVVSTTE
ncbi:MAG: hypothetical protein HY805_08780 [Nitrospirae bacterium]|nr:hypothetical protein [Nitrospirota bacterium]